MLLNFSILPFLVGLVVFLTARADIWVGDRAEDDVKVSALLCSALLFLHGSVDGIDSSLCLGFMSSDDCFRRLTLKFRRRIVGRGEVPVERFM